MTTQLQTLMPEAATADHIDIQKMESESEMRAFIADMFSYTPAWLHALYAVRSVIAKLLRLPHSEKWRDSMTAENLPMIPGAEAKFFTVCSAQENSHWIAEVDDRHLKATLAVWCQPATSGSSTRYSVATVVHYQDWTGPLYFTLIKPFHILIVRKMMQNAA